jgi:ABC-type branched-subunit amino acid transport system ATPase component/branched-subunit amino acid ABC-type transport system permease component
MNDLLPFIITGLSSGAVYGLAGVGLVLTFKTSGIFNFGQGSVAALSAFVYYFLSAQQGVAWPVALVLAGVIFPAVLGLLLEILSRALTPAPTTIKVVATIGIVLITLSVGELWYPGEPRLVQPFLPQETVKIGGVFIGWDQIIILVVSLALTALLYAFFRLSRRGMAMRAVVEDPDLLARTATSPTQVRRWAWVIGTSFAGVSGIALAPTLGLDPLALTLLVVQAFGAAAIGAFSSLPLTYVGGLVIGVAASLATKYTAPYPSLGGLPAAIPFVVLFVVLICTPRRKLIERIVSSLPPLVNQWRAPAPARLAGASIVVAAFCCAPLFAGVHLVAYSAALPLAIILLSLSLLVTISGQVSLGHLAFAAVGAAAMAHLSGNVHIPWLLAVLLAALIVVPVGAIVAIPAIRLSGIYLAIATLGFGILMEQLVYPMNFMFHTAQSGIPTRLPSGGIGVWQFDTNTGFYYVLLVFLGAVAILLQLLRARPLGRMLRAMRDSSVALQVQGSSTRLTLLVVTCISAFIAGLGGALTAAQSGFAVGTDFSSFSSILLFATIVVINVGDPWNALIGAVALSLIPSYFPGADVNTYLQLAFGIAAVLAVYTMRKPIGVPHVITRALDRTRGRPAVKTEQPLTAPAAVSARRLSRGVEVRNLSVRFGAVIAVDNVSIHAPVGKITGLIGPNGAGKTTTFNACSGLVKARSGDIELDGRSVMGLPGPGRAVRGLGRTFQSPRLFDSLSVAENVALGIEAYLVGRHPSRLVRPGRLHRREVAAAAREAMAFVGIESIKEVQAGALSVGQRRLIELARCIAAPFGVLLLDEPSAGLDRRETAKFAVLLRRLVRERGVGILLVEHDMDLVRSICDYVYVLDFGTLIFEGPPAELVESHVVRSAYLGDSLPGLAG